MASGRTIAQKVLADRAGARSVDPGDHVTVEPDWVFAHDLSTYPGMRRMRELGHETVFDPDRLVVVFDHHVPSSSERVTTQMGEIEEWVREQGVEHFYDAGRGICHNVMAEEGFSLPGTLILGADSHTTTHGAFGAFATGIGHTDLGEVMGAGELWLRVPETREVVVEGDLPEACAAKDLALALMGELTTKGAIYQAIEYRGEGVEGLAMHERQTLSNLAVELGASTGIVPADETTLEYVEGRAKADYEPVDADGDADYVGEHRLDADDLEPLVAAPSRVDNVAPVREHAGRAVDQVFVGTCNNGRYEDVAAVGERLAGESVARGTDLIVVPGSREVLTRMNDEGVSNAILEAGGTIGTPGCGPCFGAHGGVLGEGDVCVGTMNRNFPGRMGPGEIYLASPETAAAAAIYGEITDPREVA